METAPVRVTRSVRLDLDLDAAWRLVGTEDGLARWLGGEVRLDPSPGAALHVRDDEGVERAGRVLAVEDGRRLTFEWATAEGTEAPSTVTLAVEEDGDGTRVTVVEEHAGGSVAACADIGAAWENRLLHLELGSWAGVPAFAGRGEGDLLL